MSLAIPYNRLANVPALSILGNDTGSARTAKALTQADVLAYLNLQSAVSGPASSVDNEVARYDGTTGKLLQGGAGVTIDDSGTIRAPAIYAASQSTGVRLPGFGLMYFDVSGSSLASVYHSGTAIHSSYALHFSTNPAQTAGQVQLWGDVANVFTQRNGLNPQTARLAGTYTSTTSFEALQTQATGTEYRIGSVVGSAGGSNRNVVIGHTNAAGTWTPVVTIPPSGYTTIGGSGLSVGGTIYESARIWSNSVGWYMQNVNGTNYDTKYYGNQWNANVAKYLSGIRSLKPFVMSSGEEFVWMAGNAEPSTYTGSNYIAKLDQTGTMSLGGLTTPTALIGSTSLTPATVTSSSTSGAYLILQTTANAADAVPRVRTLKAGQTPSTGVLSGYYVNAKATTGGPGYTYAYIQCDVDGSSSGSNLPTMWSIYNSTTSSGATPELAMRIRADKTAELLGPLKHAGATAGLYNATPIPQASAMTTQLTAITHTAPGTPDYAIADLTTTSPWGFASQDEGQTVLSVIANLQTRVAELESMLSESAGGIGVCA